MKKSGDAFVRLAKKLAKETMLDGFIHDGPEGDLFALREAYNERYAFHAMEGIRPQRRQKMVF